MLLHTYQAAADCRSTAHLPRRTAMSNPSSVLRLTLFNLFLLFAWLCVPASAQQFTGTLQGTVQDANGAVVPGAEVSITNQNTNVTVNTTTGGNGNYIVPQLPP